MERIRSLNRYQKGILLLTVVIALAFTAVYFVTTSRVGFSYRDAILLPGEENGTTVYSGKIQGVQASFRVSPDKTVEFQYGEKYYGPYTAKEDPTALPEGETQGERLAGMELRKGEEILFRGGVSREDGFFWLYDEDGSLLNTGLVISVETSNGTVSYENGKEIDPMEPSASTILKLMTGPELTHKGEWLAWFLGIFTCIATAVSILFAEELFQLGMMFRVQDPEGAEPSDWVLAGRYISWTVLPFLAMALFFIGLQ